MIQLRVGRDREPLSLCVKQNTTLFVYELLENGVLLVVYRSNQETSHAPKKQYGKFTGYLAYSDILHYKDVSVYCRFKNSWTNCALREDLHYLSVHEFDKGG